MFSLYEYYHGLPTMKDKKEFMKKVMRLCNIKKGNFYQWIVRDDVPNAHRRTFAREIMQKPNLFDK